MKQQNEREKKLKDYISKGGIIVIDRIGVFGGRGFDGNKFEHDLFCSIPNGWREATKEEVIGAFKKHLIHRYSEDWETMKIKKRHPSLSSSIVINDGLWNVEISKEFDGWNVCNKNGLLYCNGIWVERLEEEPKIHIKDAIKENTAIHCETEEEAERILKMANELGYRWYDGDRFTYTNEWNVYGNKTCYDIKRGIHGGYRLYRANEYTIINSTDIKGMKKSTEWSPAPEDIEEMNKKASEKRPIDKVTTRNLGIALRMVGIQLDVHIIDKVIDLVELIENKGDDVTIKDIVSLQQTWSRHSQAFH